MREFGVYVRLTCPIWWVSNLQVEDLEESMHKDVSSVAHRQELKHSELQGLISTLNHDLKGLQREVRFVGPVSCSILQMV
jgi:hypothetical protein